MHYLRDVLRLDVGAAIALFNGTDGEWRGRIAELGRHRAVLSVTQQTRPPEAATDLWLLFAPLKRARLDWLVEKATELGVSVLWPVRTAHTQAERLNMERLRRQVIEAAEQSERLTLPELRPPERLVRVLAGWPEKRHLLVCDETGAGEPAAVVAARRAGAPLAVLIGPEGGFAETELDPMGKLAFVSRIGLGPRVLRAETAALAALAVVQAVAGDWRRSPRR